MLRQIHGTIEAVEDDSLLVSVGGFGLQVALSGTRGYAAGDTVTLATYLAVKQDGIELYGFSSEEERTFFERLLRVPGVGPKTALSLLRRASREQLEGAIAKRDVGYLTRVVGLGKKTAEKLIVEIADKMNASSRAPQGEDTEVFDTLVALGYTEREARAALSRIPESTQGKEARLRAALNGNHE